MGVAQYPERDIPRAAGLTPLQTARLELIAASAAAVSLELQDVGQFVTTLDVPMPASWPAPLNDESSQRWYLDMLRRDPNAIGWGLWYVIRRRPRRELIGVAGFKGRPADGSCELGYSVLPGFQRHGSARRSDTCGCPNGRAVAFRDDARAN